MRIPPFDPDRYHLCRIGPDKKGLDKHWRRLSRPEVAEHAAAGGRFGLVLSQSDIAVVDIDIDKGLGGINEVTQKKLLELDLPGGTEVRTPSGGFHRFYRTNGVRPERRIRPFGRDIGIDILGDGGYVALYPDKNGSYGHYEFSELPAFPAKLQMSVDKTEHAGKRLEAITGSNKVQEGARNDSLFRLVCRLSPAGLSKGEIWEYVQYWNENKCDPPLPRKEVDRTVQSALKKLLPMEGNANTHENRLLQFSSIANMPRALQLIAGVVYRDLEMLLFGQQGVTKTFVVVSIAFAIAYGREWCGRQVKQGRVAIACGEGGGRYFADRFEALLIHFGINDRKPLEDNLRVTEFPIAVLDDESVDELIRRIEEWGGADLIVIDTLLANFGDGDENAQADMARFTNQVRRLRLETGAGVLVVHHSGHTNQHRPQGGNALRRNIDIELRVDQDAMDSKLFALRGGIDGLKCKHGRGIGTIPYRLVEVELPHRDEYGNPITSAAVDYDAPLLLGDEFRAKYEVPNVAPQGKHQRGVLRVLGDIAAGIEPDPDGSFLINSATFAQACASEGIPRNRLSEVKLAFREKGILTDCAGGYRWHPQP